MSILIQSADQMPNPRAACEQAYAFFCDVEDMRQNDDAPVTMRHQPMAAFTDTPEATLLAFEGERLVGVGRLVPPEKGALLSEFASVAVLPKAQTDGVSAALYQAATHRTGGQCFTVVNMQDVQGQRAAQSAGFLPIPNSLHDVPFTTVRGRAYPNLYGSTVQSFVALKATL